VPNEVDAWVLDDQAAVAYAAINRVPINASLAQLVAGHTAALRPGDLRNPPVDGSRGEANPGTTHEPDRAAGFGLGLRG
jgi:hypothetical protein